MFGDMWSQVDNNKTVGFLMPNDGDGQAWADATNGFPRTLEPAGYTIVDPGRYENLSQDFTSQINAFKKGDVEILTGVPIPPDFTTFWTQAAQQGFKPKIASVGKALLFPASVDALGPDLGVGLSSEVWWSPNHPFTSSLTGQSRRSSPTAIPPRRASNGRSRIGFVHALFEVAKDSLCDDQPRRQRRDPRRDQGDGPRHDRRAHEWNGAGLPPFAATNVAKTPLVGGQWVKGTVTSSTIFRSCRNKDHPEIPATGTMQPIP